MKISPARIGASEILLKIEREKAFSSVLLAAGEENLSAPDRALCHEIVLGTLRRQIYLDRIIDRLTNDRKLDQVVRIILRSALYQLVFLDRIPAHAAINDAVNLVQRAKKTSARGLVNAVLRNFTRGPFVPEFADELDRLSVETSHPRWLLEKWIGQFGFEETAKLAAADNETPGPGFRWTARTTAAVRESLAKEPADRNYLRELAANGKIYFQDEGSQLVGQTVKLKEGDRFLDVCAAPGSKTTQIAAVYRDLKSKLIVAGDRFEPRAKILRENCRRQGVGEVAVVRYDAEQPLPFAPESFDVVLVDAPCSGTGTIRHNPEIRYYLKPADFSELQRKQLGILEQASKMVKSGGRLIYSTCSLEIEENEIVCERFLGGGAAFVKSPAGLPGSLTTAEGFARTFPQKHGIDGFFVAVFEKK
ncbi:MAG: 16S rRNA (cytosine(967)-C(5))-methyltransferase RsmB [Acidobacteria bacterium]|nr:16S rRNA (cytosine(967)-C(5))-methyltransferase RsmB [Acidobacteriota bacterium]